MTAIALRSLAARPLRTALTALAVVLGVALVVGALTLTDTQRRAAGALSSAAYDGTDAVVSARTAFETTSNDWAVAKPTVDAAVLERVRSVPEVALAAGDVTTLDAKLIGDDGKPVGDGPFFGIGLDPRAEALTPLRLREGRWATGPGEVVLDAGTAETAGRAVGDRVRITTEGGARAFRVVGLARFGQVDSLGKATVAAFELRTAQAVFGREGAFDAILVAGRDGVPAAEVRRAVAAAVGSGAQVQPAAAHDRFTFDGLEQFISIIRVVLLAFGLVAVLVGALTIVNSLSITLAQRTRELGLLRLVGASRRQVLGSVVAESLALGAVGSALGVAAGLGLAVGLRSLLAGLWPAWRATKVAPVVALRGDGGDERRPGIVGRAVTPVVSLLGRPAQAMGGAAGLLARRNAMRKPGRTMATAGALTIGVALVTTLGVVASGLKQTTRDGIESRLSASHVVIGSDGWSPTDPAAARAIAAAPGVTAVTTVRQDVGAAFGRTERVNTIDGDAVGFDLEAGDAGPLRRGDAVVDRGWAAGHGMRVGSRFELQSPSGERLALRVRGIERSGVLDGLDLGPITIAPEAYAAAFRNERSTLVAVDGPRAAIAAALRPFPDAAVETKAAFVETRLADVDTLMAIFVVLLALAVLVSLFGLANALVLATFERRRELGMLAAVGTTRRQLRRMVRHEAVITSLLGASTGVVAGLGLGAVVTALLGDAAGLRFAVPAGTIAAIAVVAIVAGVLAATLPARRAARMSPLVALAYE